MDSEDNDKVNKPEEQSGDKEKEKLSSQSKSTTPSIAITGSPSRSRNFGENAFQWGSPNDRFKRYISSLSII